MKQVFKKKGGGAMMKSLTVTALQYNWIEAFLPGIPVIRLIQFSENLVDSV